MRICFVNIELFVEEMKNQGIQDIFVFCTMGELSLYRVPTLLQEYQKQDFTVHHHPFPDGDVPQPSNFRLILQDLKACMDSNKKVLIHCYGGMGRSCLVAACLLLHLSDSMTPQEALSFVRTLRGSGAIQTIKQYNFLNEFRDRMASQLSASNDNCRALSR
ncbi:cyclin-dependent kinase inhibitor 3 [Bombina bombina]|uniref:cyclin-dependent kinase inhibitor 3 n=1 Tax=Bombina bombina TaxID=8345 RepID=UPI00235A79FD|nr:cyclin-dependent kinase inhibitor 3 [Bombina bombina]